MTDFTPARVVLVTKPGCYLCDKAREVITRVALDLGVAWAERSILDDPELSAAYGEQIPVTLVDGMQHDYWHVDESRLRAALAEPRATEVPGG
ncbi:MAG: glutaredoxin family protein [Dermatophilaceae bacterium]